MSLGKKIKLYFYKLGFIFKQLFKASPIVLFWSIVSMIIEGVCPVIITYTTSIVINGIEKNVNNFTYYIFVKLFILLILILMLTALSFSIQNVSNIICQISGQKLSYVMENIVAEKFQLISQKAIDTPEFLNLYKNVKDKCSYEPLNVMDSMFSTISVFVSLVGYAYVLIKFSIIGFLCIILFSIPVLLYKYKFQGRFYKF